LLGDGDKGIDKVYGEKKNICTGLTGATKAERKSLVSARPAQGTSQGRTPFICTLSVPIHLSFNNQQGPAPSIVSLVLTAKEEVSIFEYPDFKVFKLVPLGM
jgi:hypothetical protein